MRVVFMGTPEFAVPTLMEIIGQGHQLVACYTQPPRPAGRGLDVTPSPVAAAAAKLGLEVRHPLSLKSPDEQQAFADLNPDVAIVVAYGLLLPRAILDAPQFGCLNVHASLLPRWRGAAPINRAIMAGDKETGVAVMKMAEGLDTGPVAMAERVAIAPEDTAADLHDRLASLGADLMARALAALSRGSLDFHAQAESGATYAKKISKQEARLDFALPAETVLRQIHGLSPFPGAWCEWAPGAKTERLKILRASLEMGARNAASGQPLPGTLLDEGLLIACGEGALRPTLIQRAGKGAMPVADFLRGAAVKVGDRLL